MAADARRMGDYTIAFADAPHGRVELAEGAGSELASIVRGRPVVTFDASTLGSHLTAADRSTASIFDVRLECARVLHPRSDSLCALVARCGGDELRVAAGDVGDVPLASQPSARDRALALVDGARFLHLHLDSHYTTDVSQAELRGAYALACGAMDARGVPVDRAQLASVVSARADVRREALGTLGPLASLFVGFSLCGERADAWARALGLEWPRARTGRPTTEGHALQELAATAPEVRAVAEVASLLGQLACPKMQVDSDGRARARRRVMGATTGRDTFPGTSVFSLPRAMRRLLDPSPGRALICVDIEAADVGVAAGLSRDRSMIRAYESGFYAEVGASLQRALPIEVIKSASLGTLYAQGAPALSSRLEVSERQARDFIIDFYRAFPDLRRWFERIVLAARNHRRLVTPFGWSRRFGRADTEQAIRAFMGQATTADVMRLAVVLLDHAGVELVATVHDAVVIETTIDQVAAVTALAAEAIRRASAEALNGFELKTKSTVVTVDEPWPLKGRALNTWERISTVIFRDRAKGPSHG